MSSAPDVDPLYLAARRVLLDALDALAGHRDAIVVVGAQAVYLHTADADLDAGVSAYTTDGDLALDPALLAKEPEIAAAMRAAGFTLKIKSGGGGIEPGSWLAQVQVDGQPRLVPIDLIVPGAMAQGRGRRDARLPHHGQHAARWADGLEAAVVDNTLMTVASLEPAADPRSLRVRVAGTAALLVAKSYKLHERLQEPATRTVRIKPKDAGDVIRLMRGTMSGALVGARLAELATDGTVGPSVRTGVGYLQELFAYQRAPGVRLAIEALAGALDEEQIRVLAPAFIADLLSAYGS